MGCTSRMQRACWRIVTVSIGFHQVVKNLDDPEEEEVFLMILLYYYVLFIIITTTTTVEVACTFLVV